jgi:glycosyltransferase involved in cell wall biosynthesis
MIYHSDNDLPMITAVCCTYGRFAYVERVVNYFLAQTYPNKEMVLYNTHEEPYGDKDCYLLTSGVLVINNAIDRVTKEPYTNVGAIRRDALRFASGDYVITFDDDDVFLPFFMQQAIDRMKTTKLPCFKPDKSFFYAGGNLMLVKNTMEASVVAKTEKVREYGYLLETGKEGLGWYTKMRDNKELDENDSYCLPPYCFDWHSNMTGGFIHRQSGDIDNPENFDNHKRLTTDFVAGRFIRIWNREELLNSYKPYLDFFAENRKMFPEELYDLYVGKNFHLPLG